MAAAPAWLKTHSMGEYVYDWQWASAAKRAGFDYYPKLILGVPFTPVTGRRMLMRPDVPFEDALPALLTGVRAASEQARGVHVLFNTRDECAGLEKVGLFPRHQFQFQWYNDGFTDFNAFLASLPRKVRKEIRRERKALSHITMNCIRQPGVDDLDFLYDCYANTCDMYSGYSGRYLNREFFHWLAEHWNERLLAVIAETDHRVAGAFCAVKGDRLYGRHWGAIEDHRFLHFEVCYYTPLAYAIDNGFQRFEPGHGGKHKQRRGFVPTITRSSHALFKSELHAGLQRAAAEESVWVEEQVRAIAKPG